jgi:hypothetical protein
MVAGDDGSHGIAVLDGERIRLFEERFATTSSLHELSPDGVVVLYDPFRPDRIERMIVFWSRLRFASEDSDHDPCQAIAEAVSLHRGGQRVQAILIEPNLSPGRSTDFERLSCPVPEGDPVPVWRVAAQMRAARVRVKLKNLLNKSLLEAWPA